MKASAAEDAKGKLWCQDGDVIYHRPEKFIAYIKINIYLNLAILLHVHFGRSEALTGCVFIRGR